MKHVDTGFFGNIVGKTIVGFAKNNLTTKLLFVCSDGSVYGLRSETWGDSHGIMTDVKFTDFTEEQLVSSGALTVEEARAVYDAERARWQNHQDEIDRQTFDRLKAKFEETK